MVKKHKSDYYLNLINESKGNSKVLWKHINELKGKNTLKSPTCIEINDETCNDTKTIVNEFNKYFTQVADSILSQSTKLLPSENYKIPNYLREYLNQRLPQNSKFEIPLITEMEVKKALKSLDESKATGNDLLAAKYLKLASNGLACHLSEIINTSITKGVFSDLWKSAKVLPIFKNGDDKDMDNYSPISILNILSKIIESHVHNAFYAYLNNHDLISKYQSGF